jgi:hypothetical protein
MPQPHGRRVQDFPAKREAARVPVSPCDRPGCNESLVSWVALPGASRGAGVHTSFVFLWRGWLDTGTTRLFGLRTALLRRSWLFALAGDHAGPGENRSRGRESAFGCRGAPRVPTSALLRHNVRAELTAEAGRPGPTCDDVELGARRAWAACRSGSARVRG